MKLYLYRPNENEYIHKSRNPVLRTTDSIKADLHLNKLKKFSRKDVLRRKRLKLKSSFKTVQGKIKRLKFIRMNVQGKVKHYYPSKLMFNGKIIIMHDTLYDFYYNN